MIDFGVVKSACRGDWRSPGALITSTWVFVLDGVRRPPNIGQWQPKTSRNPLYTATPPHSSLRGRRNGRSPLNIRLGSKNRKTHSVFLTRAVYLSRSSSLKYTARVKQQENTLFPFFDPSRIFITLESLSFSQFFKYGNFYGWFFNYFISLQASQYVCGAFGTPTRFGGGVGSRTW